MNEVPAELAYVWECPYCEVNHYRSLYDLEWEAAKDIKLKVRCHECLQDYIAVISLEAWQS